MMLETLFAQAAQGRTFLLMCLWGVAAGVCLHLTGLLRRWKPWLGVVGEALGVAVLCVLALGTVLLSGGGLRLYGLLGLTLGMLAYRAGLQPTLDALGRVLYRGYRKLAALAGKFHTDDELLTDNDEGV